MSLTLINPVNTLKRFLNVGYFITCIVLKKVNSKIFSHLVLLLVFIGVFNYPLKAQKYEIGGGIGGAVYTGDILRKIDPGQASLQGTLFGKRNFDNVWTLRAGINLAQVNGADSIKPIDAMAEYRDARFRAGIIEVSAVMEFNFLDFLRNDSEFRFSPYAFFGIGYAHILAKGNTWFYNVSDNYNLGTVVIPFGGGVKYRMNDRWTLAGELGFRPTTTDYLDKIDSTLPVIPRYPQAVDPNTGQAPPYGVNFGNPYDKDWYYFLGFTLSYTFANVKCYAY